MLQSLWKLETKQKLTPNQAAKLLDVSFGVSVANKRKLHSPLFHKHISSSNNSSNYYGKNNWNNDNSNIRLSIH